MIVVLVRKLLVALWKYVNAGLVIEGGRSSKPPDDTRNALSIPRLGSALMYQMNRPWVLTALPAGNKAGPVLLSPCLLQAGLWRSRPRAATVCEVLQARTLGR